MKIQLEMEYNPGYIYIYREVGEQFSDNFR